MRIAGIQRTSTIDFPGRLACVLFTKGCDLNCFYCHNRELLAPGEAMPEEDVMAFLEKRRGLLDGVVVSGGEPTRQAGLVEYLLRLKGMGYAVKLDTNGQLPDVVAAAVAARAVDYVAVDVKAMPEAYEDVCGADGFDLAMESLSISIDGGVPCEARTTLYPGMKGEELQTLIAMAPKGLARWRLNVFRMPQTYEEADRFKLRLHGLTRNEALKAIEAFGPEGLEIVI